MFRYQEEMDNLIKQEIKDGQIAGANVLVIHKGRAVYQNTFGHADKERGVPMAADSIFRIYSLTKPITAAAVMLLAERGKLDLWDPVSRYLPAYAGQTVWEPLGRTVRAKRDITVWDLLNMTSGIPYPDPAHEPGRRLDRLFRENIRRREAGEDVNTLEYLEGIARVPLMFEPGEKWMYGLSADLLGGVVEMAAGKKYGEFLQEELFGPLEMTDTGFFVPTAKKERFAVNYEWSEPEGWLKPFPGSHLGEYYGEDVAFESGGAGLVSTIEDYSHFARMMLDKGEYSGRRILGRKTVEFMAKDRLTPEQKQDYIWDSVRGFGYGCLMRVMADPGIAGSIGSIGEFGWDGWAGTYVTIDPLEEMILLYFIQRCGAGFTPLARKLRMCAYASLK